MPGLQYVCVDSVQNMTKPGKVRNPGTGRTDPGPLLNRTLTLLGLICENVPEPAILVLPYQYWCTGISGLVYWYIRTSVLVYQDYCTDPGLVYWSWPGTLIQAWYIDLVRYTDLGPVY